MRGRWKNVQVKGIFILFFNKLGPCSGEEIFGCCNNTSKLSFSFSNLYVEQFVFYFFSVLVTFINFFGKYFRYSCLLCQLGHSNCYMCFKPLAPSARSWIDETSHQLTAGCPTHKRQNVRLWCDLVKLSPS